MRTQMFLWLILGAQSLVPTLGAGPKPDAVSSPVQVLEDSANRIRDVAKQLGDTPTPVVVPMIAPELWIPFGPDNKRLDSPALIGAASEKDGSYMLLGLPKPGDVPQYRLITIVTLTGPRPPPVVVVPPIVPPGPGPAPQPPIPPDVKVGSKHIVVIRESLNPSPEMGRLIVLMQSGPIGAYMASKGHTFESFDKDAVDESGSPSKYVKKWLDAVGTTELPAAAIVNKETNIIESVKSLGQSPTADGLLSIAKGVGG